MNFIRWLTLASLELAAFSGLYLMILAVPIHLTMGLMK